MWTFISWHWLAVSAQSSKKLIWLTLAILSLLKDHVSEKPQAKMIWILYMEALKFTFENHLTHLTHRYKHKLRLSFGFLSPSEHDLAETFSCKILFIKRLFLVELTSATSRVRLVQHHGQSTRQLGMAFQTVSVLSCAIIHSSSNYYIYIFHGLLI